MPRRTVVHPSPFNAATLVQIGAIPVLAGCVTLLGFYYVTGDTLNRHEQAIKTIQVDSATNREIDNKARDEARKAFLDNQLKTAEVLGQLNTRLAVSETKQETANQTLAKIADELSRITAGSATRR